MAESGAHHHDHHEETLENAIQNELLGIAARMAVPPNEVSQDRRAKLATNRKIEKLERNLLKMQENVDTSFSTISRALNDVHESNKAILQRMEPSPDSPSQDQPEPRRSRRSSVASSIRGDSRAPSPHANAGVAPLFQSLAYGTSNLLQGKTHKYEKSLKDLKEYARHNSVQNRVEMERDIIAAELRNDFLQLIPKLIQTQRIPCLKTVPFIPGSDTRESNALFVQLKRENLKEFPRLSKASPDVRHIIEAMAERHAGELTAKQFANLIIHQTNSQLKDTFTNIFKSHDDINEAIKEILESYCCSKRPDELLCEFYDSKIDTKKVDDSLTKIVEKARLAFPEQRNDALTKLVIDHVIPQLPSEVQKAVNLERTKIAELQKISPFVPPMDLNTFKNMVTSHPSMTKRVVKNLEAAPQAINNEHTTTASVKTGSSNHSNGHFAANNQIISEMKETNQLLMKTVAALENQPKTYQNEKGGYNRPQKSKLIVYKISDPKFSEIAAKFDKKGPLMNVLLMEIDSYERNTRKRGPKLKMLDDPHARIPYKFDNLGRIIPENAPIDFPVFVETQPGKYRISLKTLERISISCARCGHLLCGFNAENCIYKSSTPSFNACSKCMQGFHLDHQCRAVPLN